MRYPKIFVATWCVLALTSITSPAFAMGRGPSTPEERTRVVQLTKSSEANLMHGLSDQDLSWFLKFIQEVPDLAFNAGPVGAWCVTSVKTRLAPLVVFHFMLAAVAFQIEHPDKAQDSEAVDLAALNSFLLAYQNLVKASPEFRAEKVDKVVAKRDMGTLPEFVRQLRAKAK
jgi:hypothetical protein